MRYLFILLIAAVSAVPAFGQYQVQVDPPVPVEGEPFTVTISGTWRDSCVPDDATVFVTGNSIIPTFPLRGDGGCLLVITPFEAEVRIPGRPRGEHEILVRLIDFDGTVRPLAVTTVTVTPSAVEPLEFASPDFGPSDRRTPIRIGGSFHCSGECPAPRVWLGEVEAEVVLVENDTLITAYTPLPANPEEVVDVVVRRGPQEWRLPGGFRYLARDEFETILVPIWLRMEVEGVNGSEWNSVFFLHNGHEVVLIPGVDLLSVDEICNFTCPSEAVKPGETAMLRLSPPLDTSVPSAMLYIHRTLAGQISLQARTQEVSRQKADMGTEVPVVRGSTMSPSVIRLLDVPLDDDFRVMLRMYGLADGAVILRVFHAFSGNGLLEEIIPLQMSARSLERGAHYPREPAYAQVANLKEREELRNADRVRIEMYGTAGPIWGMASVTHVESQHVTLVTPQ